MHNVDSASICKVPTLQDMYIYTIFLAGCRWLAVECIGEDENCTWLILLLMTRVEASGKKCLSSDDPLHRGEKIITLVRLFCKIRMWLCKVTQPSSFCIHLQLPFFNCIPEFHALKGQKLIKMLIWDSKRKIKLCTTGLSVLFSSEMKK